MNSPTRSSPEVRERAVRLVLEHQGEHDSQWSAITSVASKLGCTAETLRKWVRQASATAARCAPRGCGWRDLATPMAPIGSETPNRESAPVRGRSASGKRGTVSPLTRPTKTDSSICCQQPSHQTLTMRGRMVTIAPRRVPLDGARYGLAQPDITRYLPAATLTMLLSPEWRGAMRRARL